MLTDGDKRCPSHFKSIISMIITLKDLQAHQANWARQANYLVDAKDYVDTIDHDLLSPMSPNARLQYLSGRGGELRDKDGHSAKIRALHSSAALVVNLFDYWMQRDKAAVSAALGLDDTAVAMQFEYMPPLPTGTTPPNLDLIFMGSQNKVVAIESKFTEWTNKKSYSKPPISERYFTSGDLWRANGLEHCQTLAESYRNKTDNTRFRYLDVPQLLKHALGLAYTVESDFALWYLCFDFLDDVSVTCPRFMYQPAC